MHLALAALLAVSPRWAFEDAYDNVKGGDWYIGVNNETADLAWGESYVLWSLMAMVRSTGHPRYVDRLARHLDALLAQRDDSRGVTDYRGVAGACWRNTSYQKMGEPYCYAVHSGMLIYPMAELAAFIGKWRHRDALAYDGQSFAAKAAVYTQAAIATAAYHDDEWNDAGYYVFRGDAVFLEYAGVDQPLNQSNAMGLALLALYDATGDPLYLGRATALASRLRAMMAPGPGGGLVWNYWGGPYATPGEDISHAALNVEFAVQAAARGLVFGDADLDAIAATFLTSVYLDDQTFADFIGGGTVNGDGYRPQIGRWLPLTPRRAAIYAAVHDAYQRDYPAAAVGSGSLLLAWAYLAEFEPRVCPHFFYPHDWQDLGDAMQATAYGANVLTIPPALTTACRVPLSVQATRRVVAAQWDGADMHRVAEWQPGPDFAARSVAYEPRWPLVYFEDGVLFEFQDDFAADEAVRVRKPAIGTLPTITSPPPTAAELAVPLTYTPTGAGSPPFWWSLRDGPDGLAVDPATGVVEFTPQAPGEWMFRLALENDLGEAEQAFVVHVPAAMTGSTGDAPTSSGDTGDPPPSTATSDEPATTTIADTGDTSSATSPDAPTDADAGCGCRSEPQPGHSEIASLALLALLRRRRRPRALPWLAALGLMACRAPAAVEAPAQAPVTAAPTPTATAPAPLARPATTEELVPLSFPAFVIAVDDEALYAVRGPEIVRMPLAGGELTIVAQTRDPEGAQQVELHGGYLYFIDQAEVWRVPTAGGPQQRVVPRQPYFAGYAVAGGTVYWLNGREPIQDTPPFRRVERARPGVYVMSSGGKPRRVASLPELRAGSEAFSPLGPIVCRENASLCAFVAREGVYTVDTRGTSTLLAKVLPYVLAVDGSDFVAADRSGDSLWLLSTSGAPQRKLAAIPGVWGLVVDRANFYVIDRVGSVLRVPRSGEAPQLLVAGQNTSIVRNSTHLYALNPANERLVRIGL